MHTIRTALMQVDPEVPFVDSSPSNQIKTLDPYSKRWSTHHSCSCILLSLHPRHHNVRICTAGGALE